MKIRIKLLALSLLAAQPLLATPITPQKPANICILVDSGKVVTGMGDQLEVKLQLDVSQTTSATIYITNKAMFGSRLDLSAKDCQRLAEMVSEAADALDASVSYEQKLGNNLTVVAGELKGVRAMGLMQDNHALMANQDPVLDADNAHTLARILKRAAANAAWLEARAPALMADQPPQK